MSWVTVVWTMLTSVILTLALLHLFIWLNQRRQWAHLFFAITAIAVAVVTVMEFMTMRAVSIEQMAMLLRWVQIPFFVIWVAIICFVHFYFAAGRLWLAWTVCGLRTLVLTLDFTTGQNLFFQEITHLKQITFLGGEIVSIAQGVLNPAYIMGPISALALIAFVVDASITQWHKGTDTKYKVLIFSGCISFFMLTTVANGVLVNAGVINSPYMYSFYFIPVILAASYELSLGVLRSTQLAHRLLASETELHISEQRMSLAMSAADLGLWEWDIVHDTIWSTDNGYELYGIDKTERVNFQRFMQTVYPEDRERIRLKVEKSLTEGGDYEDEYRIVLPNKQIRWLATFCRIEINNDRLALRMHGMSIDITRRKQAELNVQQQRNEITHLSRVSLLGELSGSLAHELNQPLTAILSNAQAGLRFLAQEDFKIGEVRDILKDIVTNDKRAGDIIQRLRLLHRKAETRYQALKINEVIRGVLKLVGNDLVSRNIMVKTTLATPLPLVMGDYILLQQVLLNLIVNACDAMPHTHCAKQRQIHIQSCWSGDALQVSVSDCGRGIAIQDMERIFEPFFSTKSQGLGLGLAICRTIIKTHNGQLWAVNNIDGGASVYFTLPSCQGYS